MFRQHKILCENKEAIIYLFLYNQEIELKTIKNIFTQLPQDILEKRIIEYLNSHHIKFIGKHIKIVYSATIVKDFYLNQKSNITEYASNIVNFYR